MTVIADGCLATRTLTMSSTGWLLLFLYCSLSGGLLNSLCILLILVDSPIKDIIVLEPFTNKEITEDLAEVRIVGLVIKAKGASIVEVDGELVGEAST